MSGDVISNARRLVTGDIEGTAAWLTQVREAVEALCVDAEQRRLRARDAVELLRESFKLRTNCNMVDDAAEDACAQIKRLRHPYSKCVEQWQAMSNSLQAEVLALINGYAMDDAERSEVRPGGKWEHYHWAALVLGVYANEPVNKPAMCTGGHCTANATLCYRHCAEVCDLPHAEKCVGDNCDEAPVLCVEHAGIAVTIANQHAEQYDEQG